jgi:hypothetical protein
LSIPIKNWNSRKLGVAWVEAKPISMMQRCLLKKGAWSVGGEHGYRVAQPMLRLLFVTNDYTFKNFISFFC